MRNLPGTNALDGSILCDTGADRDPRASPAARLLPDPTVNP